MTERKRLKEMLESAHFVYLHKLGGGTMWEEIADYLLERGAIMPCIALGQKVYFLRKDEVCEARIINVEANFYTEPRLWLTVEYFSKFIGRNTYKTRIDLMIGKVVFLSREVAENVLAEMSKK